MSKIKKPTHRLAAKQHRIDKTIGEDLAYRIRSAQINYDKGMPVVSNEEFDSWVAELRKKSPQHPVLQELGKPLSTNTVRHQTAMLSLDKSYSIDEVVAWARAKPIHGIDPSIPGFIVQPKSGFIVQPKLDGVALSIMYNGIVRGKAATRGDGLRGDHIGLMKVTALNIPSRLRAGINRNTNISIRGEVVMPLDTFEKKYAGKYANPRNMIAGALSSGSTSDCGMILGDAMFLAYDIVGMDDTLMDSMRFLDDNHFVVPQTHVVPSINDLAEVLERASKSSNLLYPIDGWVVKYNSRRMHAVLGATAHHPRWAIALKLQGDTGTTTVRDIEWETSRTGTVTPVAIMDPVSLSGAQVRRASLHHWEHFQDLALRHGSEIIVTRRGGIIPHVEGVKSAGGGDLFVAPTKCRSCHNTLDIEGKFLHCNYAACEDQVTQTIEYWFKTVGALGLGSALIKRMFAVGNTHILDFYMADVTDFRIAGCGQAVAQKHINEILRTKTMSRATFLCALGLPHVGKTIAERLVQRVEFDMLFRSWTKEVTDVVFDVVGGAYLMEVANACGQMTPTALSLLGVVQFEDTNAVAGPMNGMSVVFTGALTDMDRETARAQARSLGAETPSNLTRDTTHLVVGDRALDGQTGKRDKAAGYNAKGANIKIMSETEWAELICSFSEVP